MKNSIRSAGILMVISFCMAMPGFSEKQPSKGAKALFYDSTSGTTIQGASRDTAHAQTMPRVNTGLKYWVELVQPNSSQILRVSSTRAFHSGERIRLHFESNVDGRISLLQINPDGSSRLLFPDQRVNNADNRIKAGMDATIPSGDAWFTFDTNPGMERILVFLTPDSNPLAPSPHEKEVLSAKASTRSVPGTSDNLQAAPPGGTLNSATTAGLAAQVEKQRGSKALVLEVDDKSEAPAEYAVRPVAHKNAAATGQDALAIEIQLKHQ
jgi:hypothetical protein